MSLVRQVKERLEATLGPSSVAHVFDRVSVAADALIAGGELKQPVEAWIVSFDTDAAKPRAATGPVRQLVTESVLVMLGFLYAGHDGSLVEPEDVEGQVIEALLGWVPNGRAKPMELRGSRLMTFDGDQQALFRQVVFETAVSRVGAV